MASRSGRAYTPEEDEQILALPRVPGVVKALAQKLGRTRVAISMRRAELSGSRSRGERRKPGPRRTTTTEVKSSAASMPVSRPNWFESEDIATMGQRGR